MRRSWIVLAPVLTGCLDYALAPEDPGTPSVFIALQRDFGPLESWPTYDLGDAPLEGHPPGHRIAHLSRTPAPNSAAFPVGTIIAKSIQPSEDPSTWLIHAMVKRGGDYNRSGAHGWEWFELQLDQRRVPVIVWRGEKPPNGENYGCLASNCDDAPDCNQCHQAAVSNDFVMSDLLRLSDF